MPLETAAPASATDATSSLYSFLIAASKPIRIGLLAAIKKEYKLEVAFMYT